MRLRTGLAAAAAAASLAVLALPGAPAGAAPGVVRSSPLMSCATPGGGAALQTYATWRSADSVTFSPVYLADTKRDGYGPEARVITQDDHGVRHAWSWVRNSEGAGHTRTVRTSVTTSRGVAFAWLQLSDGPHTCRTGAAFNPDNGPRRR